MGKLYYLYTWQKERFMEEVRKYGDLTVRVTYGEADLTELLVEYVRGMVSGRNYRGEVYERKEDLPGRDVCTSV